MVGSELAVGWCRGGLRLLQELYRVDSSLLQEWYRVNSGLAQGLMSGG